MSSDPSHPESPVLRLVRRIADHADAIYIVNWSSACPWEVRGGSVVDIELVFVYVYAMKSIQRKDAAAVRGRHSRRRGEV